MAAGAFTNKGVAAFRHTEDINGLYKDDNLFTGLVKTHNNMVEQFDLFTTGYAFFKWLRLPEFMEKNDSDFADKFRAVTENDFMSLSGIPDYKLDTDQTAHGFTGNEMVSPTNMKKEGTTFTLKFKELAGSPIREMFQYWLTGIRDPETGLAHGHGFFEDNKYSLRNYTGELLYVVTDPTGGYNKNSIEFACAWTRVFPTVVPRDHLNFNIGEHNNNVELSIEFAGNMHESDDIRTIAKSVMENYKIQKRYYDFKMSDGGGSEAIATGEGVAANDKWYGNVR